MKKILLVLLTVLSVNVYAEGWRHGGGHYVYRPEFGWVLPAVVGGVIVYEATRPTYVAPPPTVVLPPVSQPAPYGYHYEAVLDGNCNCYRTVLMPN